MRDGHESHVYKWEPEEDIKVLGVIQLVHGSCEHAKRYINFAQFLTDKGYVAYANDLRGHGLSVKSNDDLGYFAEKNGWNILVEDLHELTKFIEKEQETLRIFILGHSMGSFLVRHYAIQYGTEINGLIAIGTAHNPRLMLKFGKFLAERSIEKNGGKYRNHTLNRLSYDSFCNQFKPIRTKQDWLSRDEKVVDRFIADEKCGFVFTSCAFRDMFDGLLFITDKKNIIKTPKDLPILLISGDKDPVGSNGKMVNKAYKEYKKADINNIQMKLYKDMRHEILNEIGKEEVYEDIIKWINNIFF
ncbi:alpha/beta fold hydrolase [Candidatus Clostridium stratigraminis]|uniref:Alpha/beta fold hydrolase n=1 Tax=Candidatus Clostridium stratigraminis TaxID=3381661 RepID=A0ABW8T278_9CLOT